MSGMFISVIMRSNLSLGRIFSASKPLPVSTNLKSPTSSRVVIISDLMVGESSTINTLNPKSPPTTLESDSPIRRFISFSDLKAFFPAEFFRGPCLPEPGISQGWRYLQSCRRPGHCHRKVSTPFYPELSQGQQTIQPADDRQAP